MFKEIFTRLCIKHGESPTGVCVKLGLSNAAYSEWNEDTVPRRTTLLKIADYFNVTVEYLLGKEKSPSDSSEELSSKDLIILKKYSKLPDNVKPQALEYFDFLLSKYQDS